MAKMHKNLWSLSLYREFHPRLRGLVLRAKIQDQAPKCIKFVTQQLSRKVLAILSFDSIFDSKLVSDSGSQSWFSPGIFTGTLFQARVRTPNENIAWYGPTGPKSKLFVPQPFHASKVLDNKLWHGIFDRNLVFRLGFLIQTHKTTKRGSHWQKVVIRGT